MPVQDLYLLLPPFELFSIFKRLSSHGNRVSGLSSTFVATLCTGLHIAELKKRDELYSVRFSVTLKMNFWFEGEVDRLEIGPLLLLKCPLLLFKCPCSKWFAIIDLQSPSCSGEGEIRQRRRRILQVPLPVHGHRVQQLHLSGPGRWLPVVLHHVQLRRRQQIWLLSPRTWVLQRPSLPNWNWKVRRVDLGFFPKLLWWFWMKKK